MSDATDREPIDLIGMNADAVVWLDAMEVACDVDGTRLAAHVQALVAEVVQLRAERDAIMNACIDQTCLIQEFMAHEVLGRPLPTTERLHKTLSRTIAAVQTSRYKPRRRIDPSGGAAP